MTETKFWELVNFDGPLILDTHCWEWLGGKIPSGYGHLRMNGSHILAHRFSYEQVNGSILDYLCICHQCDNPSCVNPDHLWMGTHQDNMRDMADKGRAKNGGVGPVSKLTHLQITTIFNDKRAYKEIAVEYSINAASVCMIKSGRLHSKITGQIYVERLGPRRLTHQEVLTIFNATGTAQEVADEHNVCASEVTAIKNGFLHSQITGVQRRLVKPRLTTKEVLDIVNDKRSDKVLALIYNVDPKTIYRIKRGQPYSKVTGTL